MAGRFNIYQMIYGVDIMILTYDIDRDGKLAIIIAFIVVVIMVLVQYPVLFDKN